MISTHLPNLQAQHALVVIDDKGRGYTWIAGSKEERGAWLNAFESALQGVRQDVHDERPSALVSSMQLRDVPRKNCEERAAAVMGGTRLIKYNQRDGHAAPRWVALSADRRTIVWGDVRSGAAGAYAELKLSEVTSLSHGARCAQAPFASPATSTTMRLRSPRRGRSAAFYKGEGAKGDPDCLCFTILTATRTLDLAAPRAEVLLDWYLTLAELIPHSAEPLLDEEHLRTRVGIALSALSPTKLRNLDARTTCFQHLRKCFRQCLRVFM